MHSETSFSDRQNVRAGASLSYQLRKAGTLTLELCFLALQRSVRQALPVPVASTCDDRDGDENETHQSAGNHPTSELQPSLRHARRRALRERGFLAISASPAVMALRVINSPSAFPLHVHVSWRGGQMQSRDHSRIWCLVMRSSPE